MKVVRFEGWAHYQSELAKKVALNLAGESGQDIIAGFGLLDLSGPTFYPADKRDVQDRRRWAQSHFEKQVNNPRFAQHFAMHELEAWVLADPQILPAEVRGALPGKVAQPESVNFDEPPAKLLARLYRAKRKRTYGKVIDTTDLLRRLDPAVAYEKCPALKALLDDMLARAKAAGL